VPIEIIDPTFEDRGGGAAVAPAPRPTSLEGATVGLLSNGKAAVDPFFDHVEDIIGSRWGLAAVVRRTKPNYSAPAPAEMITELIGWDAVLTGVGD
jgi:hypothetical protein